MQKEFELKEKKNIAEIKEKSWHELNKLKKEGQIELKEVKNNLISENETLKKKLTEQGNNLSDYRQKIGILQSN